MSAAANPVRGLHVLDTEGRQVPVETLWRDAPVVLGFVRHFGWIFCREQVAQLREAKDEIERRGAQLVIIGNGAPHFARAFAEETQLEGSVYTDPERALYEALGLKRGVARTVGIRAAKNAVRAFLDGHRQTAIRGDRWQQGGTAVVSKDGELTYLYASRAAGDHAPLDEVMRAIPD